MSEVDSNYFQILSCFYFYFYFILILELRSRGKSDVTAIVTRLHNIKKNIKEFRTNDII